MANRALAFVWLAALGLCLPGCLHAPAEPAPPAPAATLEGTRGAQPPRSEVELGEATWYGAALAGRTTASGERFDPEKLTAAHRTLPFGVWVEVTRVDTGQSVRVRITDRGPFGRPDRIIDLSHGAAAKIDLLKLGVARVEVRRVDGP